MLLGVPKIIPPELLKILSEMGHGDEIARHDARGADCVAEIERYAFYDRVKEKSCCVVMTGETATYANIILKKGVI